MLEYRTSSLEHRASSLEYWTSSLGHWTSSLGSRWDDVRLRSIDGPACET